MTTIGTTKAASCAGTATPDAGSAGDDVVEQIGGSSNDPPRMPLGATAPATRATVRARFKPSANASALAGGPMTQASEIVFIDPTVSDLNTLLMGLRPEVEAIVLDTKRPAARQIAAALAGRQGLAAVHVIAHGAPG